MSYVYHPDLPYRIALSMVPAIGPIKARILIKHLGSPREILQEKRDTLMKVKGIGMQLANSIKSTRLMNAAEREMEFLLKHRMKALYYQYADYPKRLKECEDGPILLYCRGDQGLHSRRSLSVVGTRKATPYGRDICRNMITGLASVIDDLVIVSGLAYGIDVIAHRAALENNIPTVAVLGHGLATIYPWTHRDTARKISEQGALVTDFHSGMGPERNNFLRRNRIIAGLADATLVVESASEGGALITADLASSYNRDVLAVPGRTIDDRSKGCNGLIKGNIAALVENPEDLISCLRWDKDHMDPKKTPENTPITTSEEKILLQCIQKEERIAPELLSYLTKIPIQRILSLLTEMELKEWISVEPGNRYSSKIRHL